MNKASLTQRLGVDLLDRADQARRAVGDDQQRGRQAAVAQVSEEVFRRVEGLAGARRQADERGLAAGGDAPGGQHRLGRRAGVHPKEASVQEQVVQLHLVQAAGCPRLVLVLDLAADRRDGGLGDGGLVASASAKVASTSRTDRPRTKDVMTRLSSALVLVTWLPNRRDANAPAVPRSFGRASTTGPAVVLTVTSR
jgi:hypothetical protein